MVLFFVTVLVTLEKYVVAVCRPIDPGGNAVVQ